MRDDERGIAPGSPASRAAAARALLSLDHRTGCASRHGRRPVQSGPACAEAPPHSERAHEGVIDIPHRVRPDTVPPLAWIAVTAATLVTACAEGTGLETPRYVRAPDPDVAPAREPIVVRVDTAAPLPTPEHPIDPIPYRLASAPGSVVFLLGGDGVVDAARSRPRAREPRASGFTSDVTPITVGDRRTGFLWRSGDEREDWTRSLPLDLYETEKAENPRHLLYLVAVELADGAPATIDRAPAPASPRTGRRGPVRPLPHPANLESWALASIAPRADTGRLTVAGGADGSATTLVFREITAETWVRAFSDVVPANGSATFPLPPGVAHAVLIRRESGRLSVTCATSPADARLAGRVGSSTERLLVVDDDGEADPPAYGLLSRPTDELVKVLVVDADPTRYEQARLHYRMERDPWDKTTRSWFDPAVPDAARWGRMEIDVNGRTIARGSVTELGRAGWHALPVDLGTIRRGDNEVRFRTLDTDYIYVGLDGDTDHGRSGVIVSGRRDMTIRRPGKSAERGEYMVRLELR